MDWDMHTIEPDNSGENYITQVTRPNGARPKVTPLRAVNSAPNQYDLEYVSDPQGRGQPDAWDTTITYDETQPYHLITIRVTLDGTEKKKDKPEVADGAGGGGMAGGGKTGGKKRP